MIWPPTLLPSIPSFTPLSLVPFFLSLSFSQSLSSFFYLSLEHSLLPPFFVVCLSLSDFLSFSSYYLFSLFICAISPSLSVWCDGDLMEALRTPCPLHPLTQRDSTALGLQGKICFFLLFFPPIWCKSFEGLLCELVRRWANSEWQEILVPKRATEWFFFLLSMWGTSYHNVTEGVSEVSCNLESSPFGN